MIIAKVKKFESYKHFKFIRCLKESRYGANDKNGGNSLNNNVKTLIENDPLEAIFALNLGDFSYRAFDFR
ncbi:MAG: hypothetical protein MZU95_04225 [Desulfomicrobium escambiense]|nr:hypothetical protein [Desulfomicrobium escambiense]